MNILMIVSWYSPAHAEVMEAGIFHYEQAMELKKYCNVALYFPYGKEMKSKFSKANERGLLTYRRRKKSNNAAINFVNMLFDFLKIKKEFRPDIIHAHVAAPAGKIAVVLGKIFHIPVIVTEHQPIELANLDRPKTKRWIGYVYENSQANICVSSDSMKRLQEYFPNAKFQLIYNGIIAPKPLGKNEDVYFKKGYVNCCIVAAFYERDIKGYQYLIPAIKKLAESGYKIILHICGGGRYLDYYKKMAKEIGVENYCIFYGQCEREKVYSIVSQMDFNISASVFECSGVSVQEAMLLGKPLVVTKSGGANSLVTADTAIVVDRESTDALVDGIKTMMQKLPEFDADSIREYAFRNFEIGEVNKKYMDLYRRTLQSYRKK